MDILGCERRGSVNYWDRQFSENSNLYGMRPSLSARYISFISRKKNCKNLLEVGFGYGRDMLYFARNSFSVRGIDSSAVALEISKKLALRNNICVDLRNEDLINTTIEKGSIDIINCFHFFHLMLEDERKKAVDVIYALLRENGIIVLNVYSVKNKEFGIGDEVEKNTYDFGEVKGRPVHFFDTEELSELFKSFDILKLRDFKLFEYHGGRHYHDEIYLVARKK